MNKNSSKPKKSSQQKSNYVSANELKNMIKPISLKKQCDSIICDSQAILNRNISLCSDFKNRGLKLPFEDPKFDVNLVKSKY